MGLLFGALTSLAIGCADLFGRRVVRERGAIVAATAMQLVALATSAVIVAATSARFAIDDVAVGMVSGVGLGVGMWAYLSGLQQSSSAVVAPIVATMSAVLPYAYAVLRGSSPAALALLGAFVALAGLIVITLGGGRTVGIAAGMRWGAVSGLGYGVGLSVIIEADESSGAWPSVGQRVAAFALMLALASRLGVDPRPPAGLRLAAIAAGVMAGLSTVFFLIGVQADATSAIVMASLFPAVTVLVGRFVYDDEVVPRQVVGVAIVLAGVIAVSIA